MGGHSKIKLQRGYESSFHFLAESLGGKPTAMLGAALWRGHSGNPLMETSAWRGTEACNSHSSELEREFSSAFR